MRTPLVVGVDAGATASRAVIAETSGRVLGRGAAAGANIRSSAGDPAENLAAALRDALAGVPTELSVDVLAGVMALSGAGAAGRSRAVAAADRAWHAAGFAGRPAVVTDLVSAHAAGVPDPCGLVLVAGTGSVAAYIADGDVADRADGYGWLLGDEGSAVRLGLSAAQSVVRALDGRGPATALVDEVFDTLGVDRPGSGEVPDAPIQRLVAAVDGLRPAELGRLAPVVSTVAVAGDAVAVELLDRTVDALVATLDAVADRVGEPARAHPPVLAGSVALSDGPLGTRLAAALTERYGAAPVPAGDAAGGAAWLALLSTGMPADPAVHARLTRGD